MIFNFLTFCVQSYQISRDGKNYISHIKKYISNSSNAIMSVPIMCHFKVQKLSSNVHKFTYFGPVQPMVVPSPPLSFNTTNLSKSALVSDGSTF